MNKKKQIDFGSGSVARSVFSMAVPLITAQLVSVLYNIVDRVYISHLAENAFEAMTGLGVCLPIVTTIMAFANLFGVGGAPYCSIERGRGNLELAHRIMGNAFVMLVGSGLALTGLILAFKAPLLRLFGASDITFIYADQYIGVYALGSVFSMISLGMNQYINSQGFGSTAMMTVVVGAVANIILDPIFIFTLGLGVRGAAIATVISQVISAAWVLIFLTGRRAIMRLRLSCFRLESRLALRILRLGITGFIMLFGNSVIQMLSNALLQSFGGDLYVGILTICHSISQVLSMPIMGFGSGVQPVIGFNYGAGKYDRVRACIRILSLACIGYNILAWLFTMLFPGVFIELFNGSGHVMAVGQPIIRLYFCCYLFMSLQTAGQSVFVALGRHKQAILFSATRKFFLLLPLILILPRLFGLGVTGVFLAEPISEIVGGCACYFTMLALVRRELVTRPKGPDTTGTAK